MHLTVIFDKPVLFTFGWGEQGLLGLGHRTSIRDIPTRNLTFNLESTITHLSAGEKHTMFTTGNILYIIVLHY